MRVNIEGRRLGVKGLILSGRARIYTRFGVECLCTKVQSFRNFLPVDFGRGCFTCSCDRDKQGKLLVFKMKNKTGV